MKENLREPLGEVRMVEGKNGKQIFIDVKSQVVSDGISYILDVLIIVGPK